MFGLAAALTAVAFSAQTSTPASDWPREFEFAKTKIRNFELVAKTEVKWREKTPYLSDTLCTGDNRSIHFEVGGRAELRDLTITFLGNPESDGDRPHITLLGDELWLFVDGKRFEFRRIPTTGEFINYKRPDQTGRIMVMPWRGYSAVRSSDSAPFMNISRINGEIIAADKIEWAFKSRNWAQVDRTEPDNALPDGWQSRRYTVDSQGLRAALDWCTREVLSDQSRQLPDRFLALSR